MDIRGLVVDGGCGSDVGADTSAGGGESLRLDRNDTQAVRGQQGQQQNAHSCNYTVGTGKRESLM